MKNTCLLMKFTDTILLHNASFLHVKVRTGFQDQGDMSFPPQL